MLVLLYSDAKTVSVSGTALGKTFAKKQKIKTQKEQKIMNIKKKITAVLILTCLSIMTFGVVTASAAVVIKNTDDGFTYRESNGKIEIRKYTGTLTDITIPSDIGGTPVTSIKGSAFYESSLTSVIMPDSITEIGTSVFEKCASLTTVKLSKNLTNIPNYTFNRCTSLKNITLPEGIKSIGYYAFNNSGLESIVIPDSVESISMSFAWCTSLKNVIMGNGVKSIAEQAFYEDTSLENIKFSESLTSIGNYAFQNCRKLKSVIIPGGVTGINKGAFVYCSSLTEVVISGNLTTIGEKAFYSCDNLKSVVIPKSVTSIGERAFNGDGFLRIYYEGTEEDWNKITLGGDAVPLGAGKAYNYSGAFTETVSATAVDSSITTTSKAIIINSPSIDKFGTVFIPLSLYGSSDNTAIVEYDNSEYGIINGQKFEATLTNIPEDCKDWGIVALSFIQSGDDVSYSDARYVSVEDTTLRPAE